MSSVLSTPLGASRSGKLPWAWLVALSGFAAMYLPVYWHAAETLWQTEEHGHGAIILAVLVWLFWTIRHEIDAAPSKPAPFLGWPLFLLGLFVYFVGRIAGVPVLEFGSQLFVVTGALLAMKGLPVIRLAWFPLLYFIFMIPLPPTLVDAITGSLKGVIANIVESLLYWVGYPIARSGVVLSIGPYQLQVADACSGLHSMFSLSALGTLFMYMMGPKRKLHLGIMLSAILPIAFVANIIRVMTLVLVTFYLGDEAGQGFLHGAAGMVLMLVALVFFFLLDRVLDKLLPSPPIRKLPVAAAV